MAWSSTSSKYAQRLAVYAISRPLDTGICYLNDAANVIEARVEELLEQDDHRLWSRFEHYRLNDIDQKAAATRVIFVNNKTTHPCG